MQFFYVSLHVPGDHVPGEKKSSIFEHRLFIIISQKVAANSPASNLLLSDYVGRLVKSTFSHEKNVRALRSFGVRSFPIIFINKMCICVNILRKKHVYSTQLHSKLCLELFTTFHCYTAEAELTNSNRFSRNK